MPQRVPAAVEQCGDTGAMRDLDQLAIKIGVYSRRQAPRQRDRSVLCDDRPEQLLELRDLFLGHRLALLVDLGERVLLGVEDRQAGARLTIHVDERCLDPLAAQASLDILAAEAAGPAGDDRGLAQAFQTTRDVGALASWNSQHPLRPVDRVQPKRTDSGY